MFLNNWKLLTSYLEIMYLLPRRSVAESEFDSSVADEFEMSDSVEDSNDFKSRSRSGVL